MPATNRDEALLIVLDELQGTTRFDRPTPTSDIKDWFKRIDKDDSDTNAHINRTNLFIANVVNRVNPNATLGRNDLLNGRFSTPNQLVDAIYP